MSITIEFDGKRVDCDDAKAATRELARLRREQRKADELYKQRKDVADIRARAAAFSLLRVADYCIEHETTRQWLVYRPGSNGYNRIVRGGDSERARRIVATTRFGDGEVKLYGYEPDIILEDVSGYIAGVRLAPMGDPSTDEKPYWCAIGVCDGVTTLEPIGTTGRLTRDIDAMTINTEAAQS